MQWYEFGLLGLIVVGAAAVLLIQPKSWMRWIYCVAAAIVLWKHFNVEGVHWQVFPLYLALGLLVVVQFAMLHDGEGAPVVRASAWIALLCCAASLALSWVLPMFDLPKPTGKYAVGVYSGTMHDRTRGPDAVEHPTRESNREVVVQFWYPAVAKTGIGLGRYAQVTEVKAKFSYESAIRTNSLVQAKPVLSEAFPVLLFNPRWAGSRVQNTFLAEDLASHGYIVVAIDHPYNGALVDTDAGVVASDRVNALSLNQLGSAEALEQVWAKELAIWVADSRFVLDQLAQIGAEGSGTGFPWGTPRMDLTRVGAFGHSFGGSASMALLGVDPRVKCAVNLDGWTLNGTATRTTQPVLFVYEEVSEVRRAPVDVDAQVDAADNAAVDGSLAKYGGLRAFVAGTQHLDFTDQTLLSPIQRLTHTGPIQGERIRAITRGLVLGFFDEELKGEGSVPTYPEVKMESFGGAR